MIPYLINCPINFSEKPTAVSIVEGKCDSAINKLTIINNQPKNETKMTFGVCTSELQHDTTDFVTRFAEWVAMLKILGAERLTTFDSGTEHPRILKLLQEQNFLDLTDFSEPKRLRLTVNRSVLQLLQITDCFYRTRNLFHYLVVLRPDEILLPMNSSHRTWHDLIKTFDKVEKISSYMSMSIVLPEAEKPKVEGVAPFFYMLHHTEVK
jgi:hypothetical protein